MPELIIDMDDAVRRTQILNTLRALRGPWRLVWKRYRPRRSDRQNRYYWPCFVQPFAQYLRDQGEHLTELEAHEMLKHKFLRRSVEANGEHMEYTPSTTELDTGEFNAYLDACAAWLADFFGIVVPEPNEYRETTD